MKLSWGVACGCALILCGASKGSVRADGCCRPVVACAPPPCTSCRPVTTYYVARRCGPIRRLLGRCRIVPAPCCRPCYPPPVPVCGPCAGPPPGAVLAPPVPPPVVAPPPPVQSGPAYAPSLPPGPQALPPPINGSSYRPLRPLAPIPPRPLTPPLQPAPVRLDRIVSEPGTSSRGPVQAIPASRTPTDR